MIYKLTLFALLLHPCLYLKAPKLLETPYPACPVLTHYFSVTLPLSHYFALSLVIFVLSHSFQQILLMYDSFISYPSSSQVYMNPITITRNRFSPHLQRSKNHLLRQMVAFFLYAFPNFYLSYLLFSLNHWVLFCLFVFLDKGLEKQSQDLLLALCLWITLVAREMEYKEVSYVQEKHSTVWVKF